MKFAASLVYTVSSAPRRNAVVEIDENGMIISVSAGNASFREIAGVAFYSGILVPGLSDMMCGSKSSDWLLSRGVRVAGKVNVQESTGSGIAWKGKYGGMVDFRVYSDKESFDKQFYATGHNGLYKYFTGSSEFEVLASNGSMEMMQLMYELQQDASIGFSELLTIASLNGAKAQGFDNIAGSIQPGKQPGLNIIEGADMSNLSLLPSSRLRRLI